MPLDKIIVPFQVDSPWGHWETTKTGVCFHLKDHLVIDGGLSFENISEPFTLVVGANTHVHVLNQGRLSNCHIGYNARVIHSGTVRTGYFSLAEKAILQHKSTIQSFEEDTCVGIDLLGKGARVEWGDGAVLPDNVTYNYTVKINHMASETCSRCCLKSILQGKSHLVYACDIFVHENAPNSTAHQKNLNHILTPMGKVTASPRLHILNRNVKASHGTATQPIPDEVLFYLRSRGLTLEASKQLYLQSFLDDFPSFL